MTDPFRALIVEDDSLIAADLAATLSGYGYEVLGPIASGEDALKAVAGLAPHFVLMDVGLSGALDGIQTAKAMQSVIDVPVVFLSALRDGATLQRAVLANPYGFLIKPFQGAELRSTIESTLRRFASEPRHTFSNEDLVSGGGFREFRV